MNKKLLPILLLILGIMLFGSFQLRIGGLPQVNASEPARAVEAVQAQSTSSEFIYGDPRPDAPELAYRGAHSVGVRTLEVVNPDQVDILNYDSETNPDPRYDRPLTLEVWYPADIPPGVPENVIYTDVLGLSNDPSRPNIPFDFPGRALRDADPDSADAPYPLVIVSHGYPGSRYMMTYLTENLASKGYIVVAIDHTESTFDDVRSFSSTLLNRSLDQLFVLDQMAQMGQDTASFLYGLVDADNTAIVGYSMGGYGALNSAGAGFNPSSWLQSFVPGGYLSLRTEGNPEYVASLDPRLKAIVSFAPWGDSANAWTPSALANITIPSLFVVGNRDDVALYNQGQEGAGVSRIFSRTVNSERHMLVYQNALHNVAPNPPPPESEASWPEYERYSEPAWRTPRLNNINQHFITAFLGMHLKGEDYGSYLDLVTESNDGVWDVDYWKGFTNRTAVGMEMHHKPAGPVFSDDFETDKGWMVNPSQTDTATKGLWERADPEGTTFKHVAYQLDTTASGSHALVTGPLAGHQVGSYDIDRGTTSIRSPEITLPTGLPLTLSFKYYLAHYRNSSSDDYLRVTVVGSTTTTVFEELGSRDIDEAEWAEFSVNLDAFAGQTVYFLIEAADNHNGSLVEAAIDDVLIE